MFSGFSLDSTLHPSLALHVEPSKSSARQWLQKYLELKCANLEDRERTERGQKEIREQQKSTS
jgi:hypothetical protein